MATYTLHVYAISRAITGTSGLSRPTYVAAWAADGETLVAVRADAKRVVAGHGRKLRSLSFSSKPNELIAYVEE
jgi:hypothetical protein